MRKIINGKMYNTETATQIVEWNNGRYGDFDFCSQTLYRKRTGEYFLYGEGGPSSIYASPAGNNGYTSGKAIVPITEKTARKWMEERADVDEYIAEFGEPEE